jgi:hypothetical protein
MSHRNLPAAIRRPTPRLGTSRDRAGRCAHRLAVLEARKVPFAPASPSRVETRSGSLASDPPYPQSSGPDRDQTEVEAGKGLVSRFCQTAAEAPGSPRRRRGSGRRSARVALGPDPMQPGGRAHEDALPARRAGTQTSPSLQARKGILLYRTLNPPTSSVDPGFETVKNPTGSSCGVCG